MAPWRIAGVLLGGWAAVALGAEPTLTHLFPVSGTQGTTVSVTAAGKVDTWPPEVWVDAPGIVFKPSKTKGKFDVEIAKDAKPGPHLVRIFDKQGATAPRFFIVSTEPEILDKEPNDAFSKPQKIEKLPAIIGGKLDKAGDVDSFAVELKKGEKFSARVEAYVLASTFDGMLRVVDTDGNQVAFNHDGRTLDPLLIWEAPRDGTFIVQLMGFVYPASSGVGFTGGEGCVYRLHLRTGVASRVTLPALAKEQGVELEEQEPNNTIAEAKNTVFVPGAVAGCIEKAGDEDRFAFTAVKQKAYEMKVVASRAGSMLDAWLKVENAEGKELTRNDDANGARDSQLRWVAPSDGTFYAVVGDVTHRGGADYGYRLAINEAMPSIAGTTTSHGANVTAGKTGEIKVAVKRANGFKTKMQLAAKGLPEGVTAADVEVPEKDGEVTLKIAAAENATAANQPMQMVLREVESKTEYPVAYFMTTGGENNGVPQGYGELVIDSTDQLWLTVIAAAPKAEEPVKAPEPAKPAAAP